MATRQDLLTGDVKRRMIAFAAPIAAAQFCQQVYQLTDTVIVGRFVGETALAAVGACAPFVLLSIALAKGIGIGASIVVSRNFGSGNPENVRKTSESIYLFMAFAGLAATAAGWTFSGTVMRAVNLPETLVPIAVEYFNIYLAGMVFLFLFNSVTGLLRGVGDSLTPLKYVAFSVVLNIGLDLLFIAVFGWGVAGAAWATVLSQGAALAATFRYANRRMPLVGLFPKKIRMHRKLFGESVRLGIPSGVQEILVSFGTVAVMAIINGFGVDVIAGYVAANRIEMFLMVVPVNLATALTSFTAQNYGAGQYARIDRGIRESLKLAGIVCFIVLMLLSVCGRFLMRLFTDNALVVEIGNQYLFVIGLTFFLFSAMLVYAGALRGTGNTVFPMLTTLLTLWLLRIPAACFLSARLGELGIWLASPLSWLVGLAVLSVYWYTVQRRK